MIAMHFEQIPRNMRLYSEDQMHPMVQTLLCHYVPILEGSNASQHSGKQTQSGFINTVMESNAS